MSLVGPSINKVHSQHMAQQEVRLLRQYLRDIAVYAYANHEDIQIVIFNNKIKASLKNNGSLDAEESIEEIETADDLDKDFLSTSDLVIFSYDFEHLVFEKSDFEALKSGRLTRNSLKVSVGSAGFVKDIAVKGVTYEVSWQDS